MLASAGEQVSFDDAGTQIDAQGECTNTDSDSAVCSSSGASLSIPSVLLGDGGDEARIASESARLFRVRGGSGDDRLHGGESGDYLFAGPGDDQLYGGGQTDRLFAGPGDDFVDGGFGGDTINGGGGRDELLAGELANDFQTDSIKDGDRDRSADDDRIVGHPDRTYVTYRARRQPVTIDLATGVAGAEGERDE